MSMRTSDYPVQANIPLNAQLGQAASGELPPGAVRITAGEASNAMQTIIGTWKPRSEMYVHINDRMEMYNA